MKILKFGGTSVGSAERMHQLVHLITSRQPAIVVLSAMSGTTNQLLEISAALSLNDKSKADAIILSLEKNYETVISQLYQTEAALLKAQEFIRAHFAYLRSFQPENFTVPDEKIILAQGELLSTTLFHFYLEETGMASALLPALNFMRIDEHEEPDLDFIRTHLESELALHPDNTLFITQGYICRNHLNEIDNLKRGGSDYTASLIGAACKAEEVQIWTDIDGMHNNDPRVVDRTYPIAQLSFSEAAELAYFGAKILHPTCILPAQKQNVPVRLLNTMQPEAKGTLITETPSFSAITAIAAKDQITALKIKSSRMLLAYGFLSTVFEIFERYRTPIDMITTSEVAISLTIDSEKNMEAIVKELRTFCTVDIDRNMTIVCIVGNFGADQKGYASRLFAALQHIGIRMISYGGSEHNISILVNTVDKKETLTALNNALFSERGIAGEIQDL